MVRNPRNRLDSLLMLVLVVLVVGGVTLGRIAISQVPPTPTPGQQPTPLPIAVPTPTPTVSATPVYYPREMVLESLRVSAPTQFVTPELPVYAMIQVQVDNLVLQPAGALIPSASVQWYWWHTCIALNGMVYPPSEITCTYVRAVTQPMLEMP